MKLTEKRKEIIKNLNVRGPLESLLRHFPYKYDFLALSTLDSETDGKKVTIEGKIVDSLQIDNYSPKKVKTTFYVYYNNEIIKALLFNRPKWSKILKKDDNVVISGKYNLLKREIIVSTLFVGTLNNSLKVIPYYSLPKDVKQATFSRFVKAIYEDTLQKGMLNNSIPNQFVEKYRLNPLSEAIYKIHFPTCQQDINQAKRHLKYEEFLKFCTKGQLRRQLFVDTNKKEHKVLDIIKVKQVIHSLPFVLSDDQKMAIKEILDDLNKDSCMSRLLQGDVGSGKTIVATLGLVANYTSNYQGALMVPTDILARQHYATIKNYLEPFGIKIVLLVADMSTVEKRKILEAISLKEIDIVIGTHSLIYDAVKFAKLGMVVIDEQHRFGVKQRLALKEKHQNIDILYMSATPIPRTLASTLYMDMDVSTITSYFHAGRNIKTKFINTTNINYLKDKLDDLIKTKKKVFVVCPSIDDSLMDIASVNEIYKKLTSLFPQANIQMLHGKIKSTDKNEIINNFANGLIDILVCTTVIEVGIDIASANTIIIVNAERYGLAQIHQLRGRIGRDGASGYCYLLSDHDNDDVIDRLKFMEEHTDGFKISEYDLLRRGPGDMLGTIQSGDDKFKIANLMEDYNILKEAIKDAKFMMSNYQKYAFYINDIKDELLKEESYID